LRIKIIVKAKTQDDRERHLVLEMPTSRMTHADSERERENTPVKTTRQSLSN
jgi:hypothetical protein